MSADSIEDIYELTPIQKGILFHSLYSPERSTYFFQTRIALQGNLDVSAFHQAWQQTGDRHPILRSAFHWQDLDRPLQVVYCQADIPLQEHDCRSLSPHQRDRHLSEFLARDRERGFDLSQPCPMRLTLFRFADNVYQFVWSRHFIILDGWSLPLVLKEVAQRYEALCSNQEVSLPPTPPYREYLMWLQQQDMAKAETFWRQALAGFSQPTPLTNLDADTANTETPQYDDRQITLSETTTAQLQQMARKHQLTFNTFVQGVWALLLSHYSGFQEIAYGCTVSGRPSDLPSADSMVGMFVNTLPIRVRVRSDRQLLAWLQELQAQLVEVRQYEYAPLANIQKWSDVPTGTPLFESIVVFENLPAPKGLRQGTGSLKVTSSTNFYKTNYPITVVAVPGSQAIVGINYDFHRFDAATVDAILEDFRRLLQRMAENLNGTIGDLPWLTERQQRLKAQFGKQVDFDLAMTS